jgi:hypothetical protein
MLFSRQDFETSARALIQACHKSSLTLSTTTVSSSSSSSSSFPFTNWQITESFEHGDGGGGGGGSTIIYLTHPPVTQMVPLEQQQQQEDDNILDVELEDDSILVDDDDIIEIESNNNNNNNNALIVKVIWNISVVYNETFQVPVLYFALEYTNGCPVEMTTSTSSSRTSPISLLALLLNIENDDDWSRVSQDLHPETGRPSYFLHPCQTSDTLMMMTMTATTITTCPSILWLWTWMSMVLPAIGHGIPSKYFLDIQQRLLQQDNQVNQSINQSTNQPIMSE